MTARANFKRDAFNTAPWYPGGWVRPTKADIAKVLKAIGGRVKAAQLIGHVSCITGFRDANLTYSEWHLLCLLAGEKTPDLAFSGSEYHHKAYARSLSEKIHASLSDGREIKLDLGKIDTAGSKLEDLDKLIP